MTWPATLHQVSNALLEVGLGDADRRLGRDILVRCKLCLRAGPWAWAWAWAWAAMLEHVALALQSDPRLAS